MTTLIVAGVNRQQAPADLWARLVRGRGELADALRTLGECGATGVVLSTCYRHEVYMVERNTFEARRKALAWLRAQIGGPAADLASSVYVYDHLEAARHLYRVTSGLDSPIPGETEVVGQIRDALAAATAAGMAGGGIGQVFQEAIRVSRRVRAETQMGLGAPTTAAISLSLVRRALGGLQSKTSLVIGAGQIGAQCARALASHGAQPLLVASRTFERAAALARDTGGTAVDIADVEGVLARADVVLSATACPGYILTYDMVSRAMQQRRAPLAIVDLAMPPDVDPRVASLPGVRLFALQDVEALGAERRQAWEVAVKRADEVIDEEVALFSDWWESRRVLPTIAALTKRADDIRELELCRTLPRLADLTDDERSHVEAMSRAIVKRMLHDVITRLKCAPGPETDTMVRDLFKLDTGAERVDVTTAA